MNEPALTKSRPLAVFAAFAVGFAASGCKPKPAEAEKLSVSRSASHHPKLPALPEARYSWMAVGAGDTFDSLLRKSIGTSDPAITQFVTRLNGYKPGQDLAVGSQVLMPNEGVVARFQSLNGRPSFDACYWRAHKVQKGESLIAVLEKYGTRFPPPTTTENVAVAIGSLATVVEVLQRNKLIGIAPSGETYLSVIVDGQILELPVFAMPRRIVDIPSLRIDPNRYLKMKDWIYTLEEGEAKIRLSGYTLKNYKRSGVTISSGVDLGQWNEKTLTSIGIPDSLVQKLKPYLGKKGNDAISFLEKNPITLTKSEAILLRDQVSEYLFGQVILNYESCTDKNFTDLPPGFQAVLLSVGYQGVPNAWLREVKEGDPRFADLWNAITIYEENESQEDFLARWGSAAEILRDFGYDSPTETGLQSRRGLEAQVLQEQIVALQRGDKSEDFQFINLSQQSAPVLVLPREGR
jgi:hypothetical protein